MKLHCFLFLLLTAMVFAGTPGPGPEPEIEKLLGALQQIEGAAFVRNGTDYTTVQACEHLRLKWSKQKDSIHSAEDFILLCGTKSSMSGKPYLIKFADGHSEECGPYLTALLRSLRPKP
jgi:hypothetical protein